MALSLRVGDGNSPALPLRSLHFEISGSLGKPFSGPRLTWQTGGTDFLPHSKDLKGGIWPRPRRGLCLGHPESWRGGNRNI
jgi:hypothetical protein